MIANASAEQCLSFIHSQLQTPDEHGEFAKKSVRRAVTISRQTGSGAFVVAEKLAHYLQHHSSGDACPWTVFDRNLMDKVLEDHNLPTRLAKFLPEDRVSQIEDILADVFEVHPPAQTVIEQTTEAHKFCLSQDRGRERYHKKYFNADINDPLLYHLIINTGLVNFDDAAKLIGDAVLNLH
jgi:hypothetical protein